MFWACPRMLKSTSGMEVVSNRRKSIMYLFRGYVPLGFIDIRVQSFDHATSSNLKWSARIQIWVFLVALIDTLPWIFVDLNPLVPELSVAGLFKYVWRFSGHQALKD